MRKWIVFIAGAVMLVATQVASAGQRYHRDRYIVGGALVGLALGAAIASERNYRGDDYRYDRHDRYDRYGYSDGYGYERPVVRREVRVYRSAPRYGNGRYCPPRRYYRY